MNDTYLLLIGIAVFSLMLIGVVLTVMEFKQVDRDGGSSGVKKAAASTSGAQRVGSDPESG